MSLKRMKNRRIGYLTSKEGKWFLNTESGENTFTNEFSAKYFATRNGIKLVTHNQYGEHLA